jgi:hypothetical protein
MSRTARLLRVEVILVVVQVLVLTVAVTHHHGTVGAVATLVTIALGAVILIVYRAYRLERASQD